MSTSTTKIADPSNITRIATASINPEKVSEQEVLLAQNFLNERESKSYNTLRQYEREVFRLYWLLAVKDIHSAKGITKDTGMSLAMAMADPGQLSEIEGSPFTMPLKPSSIDRNMRLASTYLEFLFKHRLLHSNPFANKPWVISSKSVLLPDKKIHEAMERSETKMVIPEHLYRQVRYLANDFVDEGVYSLAEGERVKTTLDIMYSQLLRIDEFASHGIHNISRKLANWTLTLRGKGDKVATIPVMPEARLAIERLMLMCHGEPDGSHIAFANSLKAFENQAISTSTRISPNSVYNYLMKHFELCAERVDCKEERAILEGATPHWLRHSGISHLVHKGKNLRHVQLLARHSDINTTASYMHASAADIYDALT